jgi:hypothetical protein
MRDIQQVLLRWGGWAKERSTLDYSPIAAGFKGLLPHNTRSTPSCCDDDGLAVDGCIARLRKYNPEEYMLIVGYYILGIPKRALARKAKRDEKQIRIAMQTAERFIEGCLAMLDIELEMDAYTMRVPVEIHLQSKKTVTRSAKPGLFY